MDRQKGVGVGNSQIMQVVSVVPGTSLPTSYRNLPPPLGAVNFSEGNFLRKKSGASGNDLKSGSPTKSVVS